MHQTTFTASVRSSRATGQTNDATRKASTRIARAAAGATEAVGTTLVAAATKDRTSQTTKIAKWKMVSNATGLTAANVEAITTIMSRTAMARIATTIVRVAAAGAVTSEAEDAVATESATTALKNRKETILPCPMMTALIATS